MKRFLFSLAFLLLSLSFAEESADTLTNVSLDYKQETSIPAKNPVVTENTDSRRIQEQLPGIVPFAEVIFANLFVWGWDRFVTDKHYARVDETIWNRNLEEGWKWDDNHWAINFFGHPYQGTMYFVAARAAGYNFYSSFIFAALGSWEWEFFAEREYPAPNDLVTTSVGGSLYGEMLFRLSRRLLSAPDPTWMDQAGAFILHPLSYVHWKVDGLRPNSPGYVPLNIMATIGGGFRLGSDYRYDKVRADRLDGEWKEFYGFVGLSVEYGNPDRKVKVPGDYFTVDVRYELGQENKIFNMNSAMKLYSFHQSDHHGNWTDVAFVLNFDSFYGDLVEMGNLSLGTRLEFRLPLYDGIMLRYISEPGFLFLGSADFNYDELLSEVMEDYEETRDYQYCYGARLLNVVELDFWGKVLVRDRFMGYLMKTMPGTEPHYGAKGYDIVGANVLSAEVGISKRMTIGARLDLYFKASAYTGDNYEPMSRTIGSLGIFNRLRF